MKRPTLTFSAGLACLGVAMLCGFAQAEDAKPTRQEIWVPTKDLESLLKQHPNAVMLDRAQYEALIKDAGKVKPADKEAPPVKGIITGAKLDAHFVPGAAQITVKGVIHAASLTDQWEELPPLKWTRGSVLSAISGDGVIVQNDAKTGEVRIAVRGKGAHEIKVEFQSRVNRKNGYCFTFLPTPMSPLALTASLEGDVRFAENWPVKNGVAMIPYDKGDSAYVLWVESSQKNAKEDFAMLETAKVVTLLEGSELATHEEVHVQSMSNPLKETLTFRLPDADANVVSLEGFGIASWKQNGAALEVKLEPAKLVFRADFALLISRGIPDMAHPTDIVLDVPRLDGASHISIHSGVRVGTGFELLGYQTPSDANDAESPVFDKYAATFGTMTAMANYQQIPVKVAVKVRRTGDHFSADVDNRITLSAHDMTLERTVALHGEEGRVNRAVVTLPLNEQFLGLNVAGGEPVEWKQLHQEVNADHVTLAASFEITWPKTLQKGQTTTLWLKSRQDMPIESDKAQNAKTKAAFAIENLRIADATRLAGYVALDFDESWKVTTTETTGLESRDARVTPVTGRMAWFNLRDYKLALDIARNDPVLDAAVIAYALPRAKQVEIEGQFALGISRAPLRKFDVKLPVALAKLLRVDSPLIGEQQLDEATGVWHFTLRKEQQGEVNIRWHMSQPAAEIQDGKIQDTRPEGTPNPQSAIHNPKLTATLPRFEMPTARRFTGQWVIEANTDTELSYETKGVQPLDALRVPPVEGYVARHRILASFGYGAADHQVKLTATRHEPSALVSAIVNRMDLTSVLSRDGTSRHSATLSVKHNGQQFFGVRLPKGATLLSAKVQADTVKPVRSNDDEVRVPLAGGTDQSDALSVSFVYEQGGDPWRGSGHHRLEPLTVDAAVPVLSSSWRVFAPDGMEVAAKGATVQTVFDRTPTLLSRLAGLFELPTFGKHRSREMTVDFMPGGLLPAPMSGGDLTNATSVTTRSGQRAQVEITSENSFAEAAPDASRYYEEKLSKIILPQVQFSAASVTEAIEFLRIRGKNLDTFERDPSRRGVNFVIKSGGVPSTAQITLELHDVPMIEALRYITELAGMRFKIEPNAVVIVPITETTTEQYTRTFKLSPDFVKGVGAAGLKGKISAVEILKANGVAFPEGSSAVFDAGTSQLIVKNTQPNLDAIAAYQESLPRAAEFNGFINYGSPIQSAKKNALAAKSGLISLDLTVPTTGRIIQFQGNQRPETLVLSYQSWERQMFWAAFGILAGLAGFLIWGRRMACLKTVALALLLTCVPVIIAPAWLTVCNALLAGWLAGLVVWLVWRIAKWMETKWPNAFGGEKPEAWTMEDERGAEA